MTINSDGDIHSYRHINMQWSLGLVVCALAAVSYTWADDCGPPPPGEKLSPPWECCKADVSVTTPEDLLKSIKKCQEKNPLPEKPPGSGPPKGPPSVAVKSAMVCASECVFTENGLLASDKTIDKDAVAKLFTKVLDSNKDWDSGISKILDKCFSSYAAEVDQSLECKSGAKEMEDCIMRESFLACPKKLWSDKPECATLKTKVSKCPKIPVMLLKPSEAKE